VGLERCGHDFEPEKSPVSKLDLVLTGKAAKDNFTAEPTVASGLWIVLIVFDTLIG
jgi:hypothetical protein